MSSPPAPSSPGHPHTLQVRCLSNDSWHEWDTVWPAPSGCAMTAGPLRSATVRAARYYEFDVTSYVRGELTDTNACFLLEDAANEDRIITINSRENGANPPQLVITP